MIYNYMASYSRCGISPFWSENGCSDSHSGLGSQVGIKVKVMLDSHLERGCSCPLEVGASAQESRDYTMEK